MMFNKFSLNKASFGMLDDTLEYASLVKVHESVELEKLDLTKIIQVDFPEDRYFRTQTNKKQIVLHHTVSGQGVDGDIAWWIKDTKRIATAIIIDWQGNKYQLFSSKYWAHHLGVTSDVFTANNIKNVTNLKLNQESIGIEIDAWGGLVKHNRLWYPAIWDTNLRRYVANLRVKPIENVQVYPEGYRGFYGFEKYTDEQIESVRKLLVYWGDLYKIPLRYNDDMWDVSKKALNGDAGVWSHTSYRADKSDCHPQPELIKMLKSLK